MKTHRDGFSKLKVLLIIISAGLLGSVGWYIKDRENNDMSLSENTLTSGEKESTDQNADYLTIEGMKYFVPNGWQNAKNNDITAEIGIGQYLLSPDFKAAQSGETALKAGASIYFGKISIESISSETTLEEVAEIVKNDENGLAEPDSVKITTILDKQVLMFNSGNANEDESAYYKSATDQWYGIYFNSAPLAEASNETTSPYYATFLTWIKEFIILNQ